MFREEEHQRDGQGKFSFLHYCVTSQLANLAHQLPEKDVQRKVWNNVGNFSKFTYWMREDLPNEGDEIQRWLNWLQLSKAIHSPLSHDQVFSLNSMQ